MKMAGFPRFLQPGVGLKCLLILTMLLPLVSSPVLSAESIDYETVFGSSSCAELIDVPDNICPEDMPEEPTTLFVNCPQDRYVSCTSYTGNPSDYGQPVINSHYPNIVVQEHEPQYYTNQCGIGHVIRTWTIYTPIGTYYCTQRITISGAGGSFGYYDIHWPLDYTIVDQCYADVHPDNLPYPHNKPRWNQRACSMIGISYKDDVFYFGEPYGSAGCRKILRTWKVIDWCQYIPNTNYGMWTYVQVIKLMDSRPPRFSYCPQDFTVGTYDNNCQGAYVNFPLPEAFDNCSQNVRITNNSPFSYVKGRDASGFYNTGTTTVRFIADDGCQNYDTCYVRVTVRDLKNPTAICYHGLATTLMPMGDDGFVRLEGKVFNAGSYDNCTPASQLRFDLVPNTFTCENRGRNEVRMIVTDASGNTDFCVTYVLIQDNSGVCPPDSSGGIISGAIKFVNGNNMSGVEVHALEDKENPMEKTDSLGIYVLDKLVEGKNYQIRPSKKASLLEGVSTLDLVKLRKHIMGEELLNDPYSIIAGDINRDNVLNIQDVIQLRMLLLLGLEEFPGLVSWRFVDKAYKFDDPQNPLAEDFHEIYKISNHTKNDMTLSFIGVKVGDLDGSCMPLAEDDDFNEIEGRGAHDLLLTSDDSRFENGSVVRMPVSFGKSEHLTGAQFTISFDADKLAFRGISESDLPGLSEANFGLNRLSEGFITFSWDNAKGHQAEAGDILATLEFMALSDGRLAGTVSVNSHYLRAEAYGQSLNIMPVKWILGDLAPSAVASGRLSMTAYPNPFNGECTVAFSSAVQQVVSLEIRDLTGRIVYVRSFEAAEGMGNQLLIHRNELKGGAGIYLVSLVGSGEAVSQRLVLVD